MTVSRFSDSEDALRGLRVSPMVVPIASAY